MRIEEWRGAVVRGCIPVRIVRGFTAAGKLAVGLGVVKKR
jgi:hypothetical protein